MIKNSNLKKVLYGLGVLVILAVVFFLVLFIWPYPSNNNPSWSPDSAKIAFTRHSEIWVMNADGTNQIKLLDSGRCPAWSPDGTQIAFISKQGDIWLMNPDGSSQRKIASTGVLLTLAWSPDGTKIAFDSMPDSNPEIWVINTDGSDQKKLTDIAEDFHPSWSPDGTKIAFRSVSGRNNGDIWIMNADGTNQTKLTSDANNPAWSPNGRITFVGEGGIWIMNADGSNLRIFIPVGVESLAWSPDGSRIAFVSQVAEGTDIWVMNSDGTNQMKLIK